MNTNNNFLQRLFDIHSNHWWLDALDIVLVIFIAVQLYKFVRGTVAIKIFIGAVAIYILWKVFQHLHMELLSEIIGQFIGVGMIALIVVFQQEIRSFLLLVASPKFYNRFMLTKWIFKLRLSADNRDKIDKEPIISACDLLSKVKTGALIVITRELDLSSFSSLGEKIDSELNALLLVSIFNKESPLHDGAVLISNNRIVAASCVLPLSERSDLPSHMGLRHRAAIGITEHSDAIAIVVSEENGRIAVCRAGKFKNNVSIRKLDNLISFLPN